MWSTSRRNFAFRKLHQGMVDKALLRFALALRHLTQNKIRGTFLQLQWLLHHQKPHYLSSNPFRESLDAEQVHKLQSIASKQFTLAVRAHQSVAPRNQPTQRSSPVYFALRIPQQPMVAAFAQLLLLLQDLFSAVLHARTQASRGLQSTKSQGIRRQTTERSYTRRSLRIHS